MKLPDSLAAALSHLEYGVGMVFSDADRRDKIATRAADRQAALLALSALFPGCPTEILQDGIVLRRDALGKPFVEWQGALAEWAHAAGIPAEHCPLSNTNDGNLHLVFTVHSEHLAGVGVDAVYLPRLARAGKNRDYLLRFAHRFMSAEEEAGFRSVWENVDESELRIAVAAHFALMEAASKACGTGLKIGLGMGRATSLPPYTLGATQLLPNVELLIQGEALARLDALGVSRTEAYWSVSGDFLIAGVLLRKNSCVTDEIGV